MLLHLRCAVFAATVGALAAGISGALAAPPAHEARARELARGILEGWTAMPMMIEAIRAQNARHRALTPAGIDRIDKQWRDERKAAERPLVDAVMTTPLSAELRRLETQGEGLFTGIVVMDAYGLNVAQSDVTWDYWQGDEAKWRKAFLAGPGAVFVGRVVEDEATRTSRALVSLTVIDPASRRPIGVLMVGVNIDQLLK